MRLLGVAQHEAAPQVRIAAAAEMLQQARARIAAADYVPEGVMRNLDRAIEAARQAAMLLQRLARGGHQ